MGSAAKDILDKIGKTVGDAADDIITPVLERDYNRMKEKYPDSHAEGMKDPEYRKADEKFNQHLEERRRRKAQEEGK